MLKRKITKKLIDWKSNPNKKPLIVEGARQVGKTFAINHFANEFYDDYIEINFILEPSYKSIFEGDISSQSLLTKLKVLFGDNISNGKTLLFLDEIQDCPMAITALKAFYELKEIDVIVSGSLLGIHYNQVSSFPVGYVERITLYPLDFEEFMWALDQESLFNISKNSFDDEKRLDAIFHNKLVDLFLKYIVIGGMPEVVKTFINTNSFDNVFINQTNIINDYKDDIAKYADSSEKIKARDVFDSIPIQLAKDNKKFQYKYVKKGGRSKEYADSIKWLIDAGIVYRANLLTNLEIPFVSFVDISHFKIYLLDTGLLISMLGKDAQKLLLTNDLLIAKGGIYENVIATVLKVSGHKLYYYERSSGLELDFIISRNLKVVPLEVKSGDNTKSKSLVNVLKEELVEEGIRLSRKNVSISKPISSVPLYQSIFL